MILAVANRDPGSMHKHSMRSDTVLDNSSPSIVCMHIGLAARLTLTFPLENDRCKPVRHRSAHSNDRSSYISLEHPIKKHISRISRDNISEYLELSLRTTSNAAQIIQRTILRRQIIYTSHRRRISSRIHYFVTDSPRFSTL